MVSRTKEPVHCFVQHCAPAHHPGHQHHGPHQHHPQHHHQTHHPAPPHLSHHPHHPAQHHQSHHHHQHHASPTGGPPPPPAAIHAPPPIPPQQQQQAQQQQQHQQQPPQLGPFRIVTAARPDVWAAGFSHQGGALRNIPPGPPNSLPPPHHTGAIAGLGPGAGGGPQGGGGGSGGGGGGGPAQAPTPPGAASHEMAKQGGGGPPAQSSHMAAQSHMSAASGMHMGFSMSNQQRPSGPPSYSFRPSNAARLVSSRSQVMTPNGHMGFPHIPFSTGVPMVPASPMNSQTTIYMPNTWYSPSTPPRQPGGYQLHPAAQQQMLFQPPLYSYAANTQPTQGQYFISPMLRGSAAGANAGAGGGHGGAAPQQPALQQQSPVPMPQQGVVGSGGPGSGLPVGSGGGGPPPNVGMVGNVMAPPGVAGVVTLGGSVGGPSTSQQTQIKPRKHAVMIVHPDTGHDVVKKMLADEANQGAGSNTSVGESSTHDESMKRKKEFTTLVRKVAKSPSDSATPPPQPPPPPETSSTEAALPQVSGAMNGPSDNLFSIPSDSVGPSQLGMNVASEPWKQMPDKERDHMLEVTTCDSVAQKTIPIEAITKLETVQDEKDLDSVHVPSSVVPEIPPPPTPVVSARGGSVRVPSPVAPSVVSAVTMPVAVTVVTPSPLPIPQVGSEAPVSAPSTSTPPLVQQPPKEPVAEVPVKPAVPKVVGSAASHKAPPGPTSVVPKGSESPIVTKKASSASREASSERKKSLEVAVASKEAAMAQEEEREGKSMEQVSMVPAEEAVIHRQQATANGDDGPDGKATQRSKQKKVQKNRDLNRKGAEKEGTDMDAFSDAQLQKQQMQEAAAAAASSADASAAASAANANDGASPAAGHRIEAAAVVVVPPPPEAEGAPGDANFRTTSPPPAAAAVQIPAAPEQTSAPSATSIKGAVNNVECGVHVNSTPLPSAKGEPQQVRVPSSNPGVEKTNDAQEERESAPVESEPNSHAEVATSNEVEEVLQVEEKEVAVEKEPEVSVEVVGKQQQKQAEEEDKEVVVKQEALMKAEKDVTVTEKAAVDRQEEMVAVRNCENAMVSGMVPPVVDTNRKPEEEESPKVNSAPTVEVVAPGGPTPVIEQIASEMATKMKLKGMYKEDQWSPVNPEGKKKYEREFLLHFRNDPQSLKKPENLPDIEIVLNSNSNRMGQAMYRSVDVKSIGNMSRSSPQDFAPGFVRPPVAKLVPKRSSQQGKPKVQKVIHVSLSLNEDPKLHEAENAWKPRGKAKEPVKKDDEVNIELYAAMRGILNKLTPQNFDKLVLQVMKLPIDTMDKLRRVIDLVFDKAVDEPNFSVAYAELCHYLNSQNIAREAQKNSEESSSDFRKILLKRCQTEFEKDKATGRGLSEKQKEIEKETSVEKQKELKMQKEEEERRRRRKSVGVTRFIGELYKLGMINHSIMVTCIRELLDDGDEESLECLCKLLTTVGKFLEEALEKKQNANPPNLSSFFARMKAIVTERKTSSRVRFMLQDAIDLKNNKWVPRRDESNPKKISQIMMEVARETLEQSQMSAYSPMPARSSIGGGVSRKDDRGKTRVDGWMLVASKSSKGITIDPGKIKVETEVGLLGPNNHNSNWSKGASGGSASASARGERKQNTYQILGEMDGLGGDSCRRLTTRYNDPSKAYTKSGSATYINSEEERARMAPLRKNMAPQASLESSRLRSGPPSKTPSRDSSVVPEDSLRPAPTSTVNTESSQPKPPADVTPEEIECACRTILEDYVSELNAKEALLCLKEKLPVANYIDFVSFSLEKVLELSPHARQSFGRLVIHFISKEAISKQLFVEALNKLLSLADDMLIDIPKFWDYIADILVVLLEEEVFSLSVLQELSAPLLEGKLSGRLVLACLNLLFKTKGHAWISEKWKAASLQWSDLMAPEDVEPFVKEHGLEYVMGGSGSVVFPKPTSLSMEEVKKKLDEFLRSKNPKIDQIFGWIEGNVGEAMNEAPFIRALTTAILESAIENEKLKKSVMQNHSRLLQRYVTLNEQKELICLYAVQALMNKLEHPKGLLMDIFDFLLYNDMIMADSFKAWEKSTAEPDGKAVALRSLTAFLTYLNEPEDGDSNED